MTGIKFNENTRVQLPAMVHLTRLGYEYIGKIHESEAGVKYDKDTNILLEVFENQFNKLNPNHIGEAKQVLIDIKRDLNNDDLGKSFYKRLLSYEKKIIDFENVENNTFQFTAEFTCKNGNDEFRPDITLFINGLPLVFIEVKKPNNPGGIIAESNRMNDLRFPNKKFRRFINITQLMIFSNNMEYDTLGGIVPIEGAFYSTASKDKSFFNCFREEIKNNEPNFYYDNFSYNNIDDKVEKKILSDFNCQVLYNSPEYQSNLSYLTPTNRILTSMCSKERILFIIKYGIAYVNSLREVDGKMISINQKHIMRYQQLFATFAIKNKLDEGKKSGVIWHTQGSGKTALSFYLTRYLTDYFSQQNKVAKFYFVVDRLDLLEQAKQEFEARGLLVQTVNNKEELIKHFRSNQSMEGSKGELEIMVVNIQRFAEDKSKLDLPQYSNNLQRIFIIDEAHRGYKPEGSFLANLFSADPNSIKIALTGTPLLMEEKASWKVFGDYIHTYYYDKSVKDGYTSKIIREDIETSYKEKLNQIYDNVDVLIQEKDLKKSYIVEHESYVRELIRYIINDLKLFRMRQGDDTLGGMVICETSSQAKKICELFNEVQNELNKKASDSTNYKVGLILHDSDDKETRKKIVTDFKKNMNIDILVVYNMLLTGFDAPRLKRLYFGRKLKDHTLLQAITRVNRPYKDSRYGYIIDFADIKKNFEETNSAYLEELERFNKNDIGDSIDTFNDILEDKESLISKVNGVKELLFNYTTDNLESFSSEISCVEDKETLLKLKSALTEARDCFNIVRTFGDEELKNKFNSMQIDGLPQMISEVQRRINMINQKLALESDDEMKAIIYDAMCNIEFNFSKVSEEELKIISKQDLNDKLNETIVTFTKNIDKEDPEFISIQEAFRKKFKEKGFVISNLDDYEYSSKYLDEVIRKLKELKRKNDTLCSKYNGDEKFLRIHKRIRERNLELIKKNEKPIVSYKDTEIYDILFEIKNNLDQKVYDKNNILKKDCYFESEVLKSVTSTLRKNSMSVENRSDKIFMVDRIKKEYMNQYNEIYV